MALPTIPAPMITALARVVLSIRRLPSSTPGPRRPDARGPAGVRRPARGPTVWRPCRPGPPSHPTRRRGDQRHRCEGSAMKVAVIGTGIIGLATAYSLAKRGAEVVLVGDRAPGSGASSNNAGWVVPAESGPVPASRRRAPDDALDAPRRQPGLRPTRGEPRLRPVHGRDAPRLQCDGVPARVRGDHPACRGDDGRARRMGRGRPGVRAARGRRGARLPRPRRAPRGGRGPGAVRAGRVRAGVADRRRGPGHGPRAVRCRGRGDPLPERAPCPPGHGRERAGRAARGARRRVGGRGGHRGVGAAVGWCGAPRRLRLGGRGCRGHRRRRLERRHCPAVRRAAAHPPGQGIQRRLRAGAARDGACRHALGGPTVP